ncbi:MAG: sialate O-acetylesterase, partial [Clostridia bacterium]|nr:sialate O-acetylesterase [Clostridia bacterium]
NMAGRGDFGEVPLIENNRCYMLRMGRWQPMSEPINVDRDVLNSRFHSGVGLAASFADETSKYFDIDVGLIPCADGGTQISQWQPGEALYEHAVAMTKLAMRSSELGGIIWHQGESDCHNFNYEEYKRMFLNLMTNLRKELNAEQKPLIIGEISEKITHEWGLGDGVSQINLLLHELKEEIPLCDIASVEGLMLKEDGIHFNSASCRELGKRYFEKYKDVRERNL